MSYATPPSDNPADGSNESLTESFAAEDHEFDRYFSLEEAASMIPQVKEHILQAHREVEAVQQEIILLKRILMAQKREGSDPSEEQVTHMKQLYGRVENILAHWADFFDEQGIVLRDFNQGLVDFPYYSRNLDEEFLLCWRLGEDGLFYFHPLEGGFAGRQPISLLPE